MAVRLVQSDGKWHAGSGGKVGCRWSAIVSAVSEICVGRWVANRGIERV